MILAQAFPPAWARWALLLVVVAVGVVALMPELVIPPGAPRHPTDPAPPVDADGDAEPSDDDTEIREIVRVWRGPEYLPGLSSDSAEGGAL